jgi:hypothetical protein
MVRAAGVWPVPILVSTKGDSPIFVPTAPRRAQKSGQSPRVWLGQLALGLFLTASLALPSAAERPHADKVDLFTAIEKGQVEVQLIPRDETQCRLLVTNKTAAPLSVKLPEGFSGVPALAQFNNPFQNLFPNGPGRNNNGRNNNPMNNNPLNNNPLNNQFDPLQQRQNNNKAPQRLGVAGNNRGLFDIAPETTRTVKLTSVCLDYGHPTPRPTMKYEVRPLPAVTDKKGVVEVCELLSRGEITRRAAQLAAWHFSNDMSWEKLAGLKTKQAIGTAPKYTKDDIAAAKKAAEKALDLRKERDKTAKK